MFASLRRLPLDRSPPERFEFIGYDESLDHVPQQRELKAAAGARSFVLRTNDIDSQRAAARAGVGIAALPR